MQSIFRQDEGDNTLLGWLSWNLPSILLLVFGLPLAAFVLLNLIIGLTWWLFLILSYLWEFI